MFLFAGIVFLWGLLVLRAAYLQVIPNKRLEALQARQFQTVITLQNRRGTIVDRAGRELATSNRAYSVYADPQLIEGKKRVARKLAKILGSRVDTIYSKIKDGKKRFVWIQRLMDEKTADEVKEMDVRGLQTVEEFKRIYPNENLMSQVLGFVGQDGQGLEGLELLFDKELKGNTKKVTVRRDARGRPLVADGLMFADNPAGAEIKLTVDSDLQHMLETELQGAINDYDADSATGVILDAKTSAILAISSAPTFDANRALSAKPELRRNRAVTDMFEPGSTMKTFVVATALKEKIAQPNTKYNTENGHFQVGDRVIKEAETKEKWSHLTVSEILAYSSNIGTTKIAFQIGDKTLRENYYNFGFGQKTGVDLPGDTRGLIQSLPWRPHLLANISFGHGIAVTALQMANAYASIANGGILNRPYIVQAVRDPESGETRDFQPQALRRVLSAEDSASLRLMLTGATAPGGTGVNAKVDGYLVAGKTGTAQKVNPNGRGYMQGAYVSSFAGFIPATEPKFVIYVVVDHPKKNAFYGSQVAAPIFSRLASYAARREGLPPVLISEKNFVDKDMMKSAKQKKASRLAAKVARDLIQSEKSAEQSTEPGMVPNWTHLTLREVLKKASGQNLQLRIRGQGVVSEIIPEPGSPLPAEGNIQVILRPVEEIRSISR